MAPVSRAPLRHILMTADAVGGVWTYALDVSAGMSRQGIRVSLAVLGPSPSDAQRQAAEAVDGLELIATGLTLDWMEEHPQALSTTGAAVAALARARGVNLVHLNSPALAADAGFSVPVVGTCHSCLATWWDAVRGGPLPSSFAWRTDVLLAGYKRCDRLIAPSQAFAAATKARYGVSPLLVHNGRDAPVQAGEAKRKQPVALTAGRLWDAAKNFGVVEQAAARMRGSVRAAGALAGPNGEQAACKATRALGQLSTEALSAEMSQAAAFVSTALYEPFGLSVLEAAQAGCALVLSDIPTFRELWDGAALFVGARDAAALARTLDDLLGDPARCAQLGTLALDRAARFSAHAMVQGTLDAYAMALRDHQAGEAAA